VGLAIAVCLLVGCGKTNPPTSGGRTASYWVEVLQQPDPDVELRRKAAAKLGSLLLLDKAVMPALLGALKDADAEVRLAAIRSLTVYSGSRAKEVMPGLTEVQEKDADAVVRKAAAKALEKLTKGG
jgi:HEAT repeat protein